MKLPHIPFSALTRKAIADVVRRKGRTILVVLGITIGVLGLTAINVSDNIIGAAYSYSQDKSANSDVSFSVSSIDQAVVPALKALPNVDVVQLANVLNTRWAITRGSGHARMQVSAYANFGDIQLGKFELSSGRYPGVGEIVMESSDSTLQPVAIGDRVTLETTQGQVQLRVVGLSRQPGLPGAAFLGQAFGIMSTAGLQLISGITAPNVVLVKVHNLDQENQTARNVADVLRTHGVTVLSTRVAGPDFGQTAINGLFTIMRVISIIALLLTCFLIVNTITTLIAEQTKIVGTMKALGGTRWTIMRGYLVSVSIYGFVGTLLGICLGILAGYALTGFITSIITLDLGPFQVPLSGIVESIMVGLLIPILAAIIPLWAGTRITVRQAIASYGVNNASVKKSADRAGRGISWVSQTTWLGLRGIFRKPGRVALTLFTLTLSGAVFMSVQTTTSSIDYTMNEIFDTYIGDMYANVNPTQFVALQRMLHSLPDVDRIEPTGGQTIKTAAGSLLLEAYAPDTQLYHHAIVAGRWFNGNEANALVISDKAANKLNVTVGDILSFSSATDQARWKIIGEVHDLNGSVGQIGVALTTFDNFNAFNHLPQGLTASIAIVAKDHTTSAVNQLANRVDETLTRAGLAPAIETRQQNIESDQGQFQIIYMLFYAIAVIVALVGILGLFNTLSTSVLERRREIGILRSMGASGWRVSAVFWIEGMALALMAWGIGVIVGIPGAYGFIRLLSSALFNADFAFNPLAVVTMLIFVVAIATLASFGPTLSASRVRIVDTLRYE